MIKAGDYYLVTTLNWFIAPDGQQYRAAWGRVYIGKIDDLLGFVPIRPSTNWFARIGTDSRHIIIAGCQLQYFIACPHRPQSAFSGVTYVDKDKGIIVSAEGIYYAEDD